ncbi:hypothetical protein [Salinisphaera sp. PC39]|uniref:hypothetical protein n=1 Tax=Salinisphaera sp. PC39 TaxID=1304156 RepID=UPI00333F2D87
MKFLMKSLAAAVAVLVMSSHAFAQLPPGAERWPDECRAGNAKACLFHGYRLMKGDRIEASETKATHFFSLACKLKLADGCHHAGYNLFYGKGNVVKNRANAFPYLANACKLGYYKRRTCYLAAWSALNLDELKRYRADAASLAHKGCATTVDPKSCGLAAWIYTGAVEEKHPGRMKNYATRGCDLKDDFACYHAALALAFEPDIKNDFEEANKYALTAYQLNKDPKHAYMVGMTYVKLEKYADAQAYFEKSCNADMPAGCVATANTISSQGKDTHIARQWYQKACDLGDESGCRGARNLDNYHEQWRAYREQVAAYEAQQAKIAEARTRVETALAQGHFNQALEIATYGVGSRQLSAEAILAAQRAGALGSIDPVYFHATSNWFVYTNANADAVVRKQLAKINAAEKASQNQIRPTPTYSGPKPPTGLHEQFMKNRRQSYTRNLQRYIDGGRPSDPRVYSQDGP